MLHEIPNGRHGPLSGPMQHAVETCVHCGFCLAACPTYKELGQEMDSPRGRIVLMKEVLEGKLEWSAAQPHIDRCLGCLACEPACPSGVPYRDLISPFRALAKSKTQRPLADKVTRFLAAQTVPFPSRMRAAARLAPIARLFRKVAPPSMRPMLELLPGSLPRPVTLLERYAAKGERRARVALLAGCAQQVLDPDINVATIEVLTHFGVEVVVPKDQGCCGGLAWHTGDLAAAQSFARRNLDAFPADIDSVVTNAAGCGSAMHEYHLILAGTADEPRAEEFRKRVTDVSVFLHKLCFEQRSTGTFFSGETGKGAKVAYHDACHLANAQGVRREPRELLRSVPGLELIELPDAHLCCGSAGTYNIDQPKIAASLGEQKARAVIDSGAEVLASGNIGCLTQLRMHLARLGCSIKVRHTMQILRDALIPRSAPIPGRSNTRQ
jgi:glycolate oxidase iron-sulfur subunit